MLNRYLDPHLSTALRGDLGYYLASFDSQLPATTITWLSANVPYQAGTTLCRCFDTTGNRTTDPSDLTCYGRGVVGGYAAGVVLPISLIVGQTREVQHAEGYLETQEGAMAYLQEAPAVAQPVMKRDDLLVVTPDPLAVPGNPDRRYVIVDLIDPVHVFGHVFVRRYWCSPIELGAVAYRVPAPTANTFTIPAGRHGTV
jgi:hypothetical protein